MDKTVTLLGISAMLIGLGFGFYDFLDTEHDLFFLTAGIWSIGAISLILGVTIFSKEEDSITS